MRSLILFRHGKSDWDAPYSTDHERPLANRGTEAARCMGRVLAQTGQIPDLAVTSTAVRARDTLQLAAQAGRWHCPMRSVDALYEASAGEALLWIRALDQNPECLLLTGHEPTWSELAGRLVGEALIKVPTGAMLRIDFAIDAWSEIDAGQGELRWLIPPKLIQKIRCDK
jgi:phosphohistidine phosphatase